MVRTSTKSSAVSASAIPVTPVSIENEVVSKPVAVKRTKKPKVDVAAEVVSAAPVAPLTPVKSESVPVTVDVVAPVTVETTESQISVKMSEFSAKLQQLNSLFSTFKSEFKTLEKSIQKELRAAQKSSSKKAKRTGNRQPSGFVKPTKISDELARFLGKEIGVEMARTAVSREINQYIRMNSLQDKANGRKINPDASLAALLKFQSGEELTYFNLQKYMKHHFTKASDAAAAAVVAV